jgi:hypothetical protein
VAKVYYGFFTTVIGAVPLHAGFPDEDRLSNQPGHNSMPGCAWRNKARANRS